MELSAGVNSIISEDLFVLVDQLISFLIFAKFRQANRLGAPLP
jgi:hypothetical protein